MVTRTIVGSVISIMQDSRPLNKNCVEPTTNNFDDGGGFKMFIWCGLNA